LRVAAMAKVAAASPSNRILSLDIIRGMFLVVILIDHIELYPSLFAFFTGEGRLYVSAAEGFFFLSGIVVGLVYRRRLVRGFSFIFKRLWRRAAELYLLSVAFTLFFTWLAIVSRHTNIKYGLPSEINWPHILYQSVILHYTFGWADFLSRFAILTFLAPFAIYLLARGQLRLLASASILLWFFRGTNFIAAWQLIFCLALIIGFYWNEINDWAASVRQPLKSRLRQTVMISAGVTFAFSYLSMYLMSYLQNAAAHQPLWLNNFTWTWNNFDQKIWHYCDKFTLGPGRLAFFLLWFSALYMIVEKYQPAIRKYSRDWLLILGQNSLFVYIAHAFIVFIFKMFIPAQTSFLQNTFITALALLALAGAMTLRALRDDQLGTRPFSDFYLLPIFRRSNSATTDK